MTLPSFIEKALAHFATAENYFQAQEQVKANAETIETLKSENAALTAKVKLAETTILDLTEKLGVSEKSVAELKAKHTDVEKLANQKALDIEASRGMTKPIEDHKAPGDVIEQLEAITSPVERAQFWNDHKAEIKAASRKR